VVANGCQPAPVAVKILDAGWSADPDVRERFIQEARIQRGADHASIVAVHDIGTTDDGRPYFVMDLADRGSLEQRLA
jgi:serine/threonine protein kinase